MMRRLQEQAAMNQQRQESISQKDYDDLINIVSQRPKTSSLMRDLSQRPDFANVYDQNNIREQRSLATDDDFEKYIQLKQLVGQDPQISSLFQRLYKNPDFSQRINKGLDYANQLDSGIPMESTQKFPLITKKIPR